MLSLETSTLHAPVASPHGSPPQGVLEGRGLLAGGATTGSRRVLSVRAGRAPAGAREVSAGSPSTAVGRFSRPSRALPFPFGGNVVVPVVSPPANVLRASGTKRGPHLAKRAENDPLCGSSVDGRSLTALTPRAEAGDGLFSNGSASDFARPHSGLCGPLSNLDRLPR